MVRQSKVLSFYATVDDRDQLEHLEALQRQVVGQPLGFSATVRAGLDLYEKFLLSQVEAMKGERP